MKTAEEILKEKCEINSNNDISGINIPAKYALEAIEAYHAQFGAGFHFSDCASHDEESYPNWHLKV